MERAASSQPSSPLLADRNAPAHFCCAINGHLMKVPVRSAAGRTFEKDAIEAWLDRHGSVCPVSGETLDRADLVVDTKLQTEIAEYRIRQSLGAAEGGGGSDDDLYSF